MENKITTIPASGDYTLEHISAITNIGVRTLQSQARTGKLPGAYKFGKDWRVRREDFDAARSQQ